MREKGWCEATSVCDKRGPSSPFEGARWRGGELLGRRSYRYSRRRKDRQCGTEPKVGTATVRQTSSGVLNAEFEYSSKKATPTPSMRPRADAKSRLRSICGEEGPIGLSAGSTI